MAAPRTGSTHATALLRNCPELNVKGQLFPGKVAGRVTPQDWEALRVASKGTVTDSASLRVWRKEHPAETLQTFYASGGNRPLVFKLFRGDLSRAQIREVLLTRDDARFMILRRRPIESFISKCKTATAGAHKGVDTTAIVPRLEASDFLDWAKRMKTWYEGIEEDLRDRRRIFAQLTYERDLEPLSNTDALAGLLDALQSLGLPRFPMPTVTEAGDRQDRERDYRKRVANWEEFEAALRGREGGARLLAWAQKTAS